MLHELLSNLLIGILAVRVSDLVLFQWPLARFMPFLAQPRGPAAARQPRQARAPDWTLPASHSPFW